MATHTAFSQGANPNMRRNVEHNVGILHFASPKQHGWHGVIRKRYTDFQVHEISKTGQVLHLTDFCANSRDYQRQESKALAAQSSDAKAPDGSALAQPGADSAAVVENVSMAEPEETRAPQEKQDVKAPEEAVPPGQISPSDSAVLVELLDQPTADQLAALYSKVVAEPKSKHTETVSFPAITDRSARTRIHAEIRRIFSGKFDTLTNSEGIIQAKPVGKGNQGQRWGDRRQNRQNGREKPTGKFLHFSLYKENRDTMEAVGSIARAMNMKHNQFSVAGTKDRRAVTVQRVSIRSKDPSRLVFINSDRRFNGLKIGDFKFEQDDLYLGCHNGNEFTIVMKDCVFDGAAGEPFERQVETAQSTIDSALQQAARLGFINYYGTQRFGTFEIGTHTIGIKILKGNFEGAVQDLLSFDPAMAEIDTSEPSGEFMRYDDINRAKALAQYRVTKDAQAASKLLPRRCNTEHSILRHLGNSNADYLGAIQSLPRNMRDMYLHAYQSLVWNHVASRRWERFGTSVIEGDLVFSTAENTPAKLEPEEDDEENIHLRGENGADVEIRPQAHALTAEDVQSGRYTVYDVILPTPGHDIIYPANEIGEYYKEFMGKEENGALDPLDMRRRQRDFSLTGSYRKLMGKFIGTPTGSVRTYKHDHDQLVPTDLDLIRSRRKEAGPAERSEPIGGETNKRAKTTHDQDVAMGEASDRVDEQQDDHKGKNDEAAPTPAPAAEEKIAVIFKFALHPSAYATIALRELQGSSSG